MLTEVTGQIRMCLFDSTITKERDQFGNHKLLPYLPAAVICWFALLTQNRRER